MPHGGRHATHGLRAQVERAQRERPDRRRNEAHDGGPTRGVLGRDLASCCGVEDALSTAGTISSTAVVLIWGLWLASQSGSSRAWRIVPAAVLPCVAVPMVLAGVLAEHLLSDVANGTLLAFAVLVSIGTLRHAARGASLSGGD